MSKFKPSKYQQAIYDYITDSDGNAVVQAVAGSGKTTTIVNVLDFIPKDKEIAFMAFNNSIVRELKEKVDKRVHVTTLHSFGARAYGKVYKYELDALKYLKLLDGIFAKLDGNDSLIKMFNYDKNDLVLFNNFIIDNEVKNNNYDNYKSNILKLADLGRVNFVGISTSERATKALNVIVEKFGIEIISDEVKKAYYLILIGSKITDKIDFTDQLFLPILYDIKTTEFDFVFVDECQDLNMCQRLLMLKAIKKGGRFIAVGDKNQAIYGFAGADIDSYNALANLPNTKILPLSCCYRCGKNIVEKAKEIVPEIEAFDGAKDGEIKYDGKLSDIKSGDMVLCRCVFPLVKLCMKFLANGIKAKLMGSDISGQLTNLIKNQERKREEFTTQNVINRLHSELNNILRKIVAKQGISEGVAKTTNSYLSFEEKILVIKEIAGSETDARKVIEKINSIFTNDDKTDGIILSSAHKSKGLEADRVFLINNDKMPLVFPNMQNWEMEQEKNLEYVAITRAKSLLSYVPLREFDAYNDTEIIISTEKQKNKEPEHVGSIGSKFKLVGKIIDMDEVSSSFGTNKVYTIENPDGDIFIKWGAISKVYVDTKTEPKVGSNISFFCEIRAHKEFKGEKRNQIANIK